MSVEQDWEQVIKNAYNETYNCLDLNIVGAAVSAGTELDAEQVLKMVFEKVTSKIRASEV